MSEASAVFSSDDVKIEQDAFSQGRITAVFGGSEMDLTGAKIAGNTCTVDCTIIFGGGSVIIPSNWRVDTSSLACVFGGVDTKKGGVSEPEVTLFLSGLILFGGLDIKRV